MALADPEIEFQPTSLVGSRGCYRGHDGLRRWVEELRASTLGHTVRIHEVRELAADRFVVLTEVLVGGDVLSPSAMLATVNERGAIVEARAYLTDEDMLRHLGRVDDGLAGAPVAEGRAQAAGLGGA